MNILTEIENETKNKVFTRTRSENKEKTERERVSETKRV